MLDTVWVVLNKVKIGFQILLEVVEMEVERCTQWSMMRVEIRIVLEIGLKVEEMEFETKLVGLMVVMAGLKVGSEVLESGFVMCQSW